MEYRMPLHLFSLICKGLTVQGVNSEQPLITVSSTPRVSTYVNKLLVIVPKSWNRARNLIKSYQSSFFVSAALPHRAL